MVLIKKKEREVKGLEDHPRRMDAQHLKAHGLFVQEKTTNSLMAWTQDTLKKGSPILESLIWQAKNLEYLYHGLRQSLLCSDLEKMSAKAVFTRLGSGEGGSLREDQLRYNSIIWVREEEGMGQGRDNKNGGDEEGGERSLRWNFIYSKKTNEGSFRKRRVLQSAHLSYRTTDL